MKVFKENHIIYPTEYKFESLENRGDKSDRLQSLKLIGIEITF